MKQIKADIPIGNLLAMGNTLEMNSVKNNLKGWIIKY
jgi:hypothetical protein